MNELTLVLNRNWVPVTTTTVRHALVMLCRESATVICPSTYEVYDLGEWLVRSTDRVVGLSRTAYVCTPRYRIEKPEVILLTSYGGVPRLEVSFSRRNLYRRDAYSCQYCQRRQPLEDLSIDHVMPRSRGGKTSWENCVLACVNCNSRKANRTPQESGLRLMRQPRKPTWSPLLETLPQARPDSWKAFLKNMKGA